MWGGLYIMWGDRTETGGNLQCWGKKKKKKQATLQHCQQSCPNYAATQTEASLIRRHTGLSDFLRRSRTRTHARTHTPLHAVTASAHSPRALSQRRHNFTPLKEIYTSVIKSNMSTQCPRFTPCPCVGLPVWRIGGCDLGRWKRQTSSRSAILQGCVYSNASY